MSDKLDAQISMTADATGVEAGVGRAKRSLRSLGESAKQVSADVGSMGDGSERAAKRVERDTKSMERSLQNLLAKLEGGSRESRQYWEKLADLKGIDKNSLRPLLSQLDEYALKQRNAADATNGFVSSLGGLQRALVSTGVAAAAAKFISVADSVTTLENQLKLATGSIDSAASSYAALFDIAQRSRVGFVELGDTFASIARAAAPLGVTQERLLNVTEAIGNAMTISGGSAQGLQAALVQLGQGLSSGTLRGEELNSVMEQAPRLAKALADGLGVTTGQLRAMGAEGEITAEKVINALESQSAVLRGEVAGATLTVGQAFTQLGNSATYAVGELDKTIGASEAAAKAVSGIASAIDVAGKAAVEHEAALKAVFGGAAVLVGAKAATVAIGGVTAAITAARVATVGFTAALAANPVGAALLTITALGAAAYSAATAMGDAEKSVSGLGVAASAAAREIDDLQAAAKEAGAKLANAEEELAALESRGAKSSSNLMLREAYNHAQRLVDKLKEAKAAQDVLVAAKTPAVGGDPYNDGTQYGEWKAREKARADAAQSLADLQAKKIGINKQFLAELKTWEDAFNNGVLGEGEEAAKRYAAAITDLNVKRYESSEAGRAEAKASKEGASSVRAEQTAYASLMASLKAKIESNAEELKYGRQLTESDKLRIKLIAELDSGSKKLAAGHKAEAMASLQKLADQEQEIKYHEDFLRSAEAERKARLEAAAAVEEEAQSLQAGNKSLRDEIELIGLSEDAQYAINRARLEAQITVKEQHLAEMQRANDVFGFMSREQIALEQQIELLRERLGLLDDKRVRTANKAAADQITKDWDRTAQTIGDTLADYIMGGGKDAAQYLKRLFATLVLQPVVQYGVNGLMGALGMGGMNGSGSSLGGMYDIFSKGKSITSIFGGSSIANTVGAGYANLTGTGIDGLLATNGAYGTAGGASGTAGSALGGALSYAGYAAAIAYGMKLSGQAYDEGYRLSHKNWLGLHAATGGVAPITLSLDTKILESLGLSGKTANMLTGASLWAKGAAMLGLGPNPKQHTGGVYSNSTSRDGALDALGLTKHARGDFTSRQNTSIDSALASTIQGLVSFYEDLGGRSETEMRKLAINAAFAVNPINTKEDAYGYLSISDALTGAGIYGSSRRDGGGLGNDPEQAFNLFTGEIAGVMVEGLIAADLPGWIDSILEGLGGSVTITGLQGALQEIAKVDAAFAGFAKQIDGMEELAGSVQTILLSASGGLDTLSTNVSSYYENFYSEYEKLEDQASALSEVFSAYGSQLPTTAAQFRALVEEQLAAGEAGAEFAAVLLGISSSFKGVADAWAAELNVMSASVTDFFADLKTSIEALSADVAGSRQDILRGTDVMTADEIRAEILSTSVAAPGVAGMDAAHARVAAAAKDVQLQQGYAGSAGAVNASAQSAAVAARQALDAARARKAQLEQEARSTVDKINSYWDGGVNSGYRYSKRKRWSDDLAAQLTDVIQPAIAAMGPEIARLQAVFDQQSAIAGSASAQAAEAGSQLAQVQQNLVNAQKAEQEAKAAYAAQVNQFVLDAGNSVTKLSNLRGEVMGFYEAQAQAVQAMLQSAGNIRGVVDQLRLGQLTAAQTAAELGSRFATDYSMALATTGSTRVGYVDSMAGNLSSLAEALKAEALTGADWRIETAKLFAQANNAAGLLQGDAEGADYESVSLGLLDSIDAALASLSGVTQSAEDLIVKAINQGSASTLDGLRAVVAALNGELVPAFAAGGFHTGGLRLVGERGPELEVTGPARYWNASQTAAMFAGGGGNERLERLLEQRNAEARAQASAIVRLQQDVYRMMQRWETQGMPEEREVSA